MLKLTKTNSIMKWRCSRSPLILMSSKSLNYLKTKLTSTSLQSILRAKNYLIESLIETKNKGFLMSMKSAI